MQSLKSNDKLRPRRQRLPEARLAELLDIAATVFIRNGYQAASLNEIARLAASSKPTLYARFASKQELFLAVIERRMQTISDQITQFAPKASVSETLRAFSYGLLKFGLSGDQVALIRMISMEAQRYPELARRYYECGPKRGEEALAGYCTEQIGLGHLNQGHPITMARQFINLVVGSPVRWFVLGFDTEPVSEEALRTHVDEVIHLWLAAYGAPPHQSSSREPTSPIA